MINIRIRYFASLKETRGIAEEEVQTNGRTATELYEELQRKHNLSLKRQSIRVAVNGDYVDWNCELKDQDEVVFIPPVAGG